MLAWQLRWDIKDPSQPDIVLKVQCTVVLFNLTGIHVKFGIPLSELPMWMYLCDRLLYCQQSSVYV